jgi:hypothetical protein
MLNSGCTLCLGQLEEQFDGNIGGFSAFGGVKLKKRLLLHEKHALK